MKNKDSPRKPESENQQTEDSLLFNDNYQHQFLDSELERKLDDNTLLLDGSLSHLNDLYQHGNDSIILKQQQILGGNHLSVIYQHANEDSMMTEGEHVLNNSQHIFDNSHEKTLFVSQNNSFWYTLIERFSKPAIETEDFIAMTKQKSWCSLFNESFNMENQNQPASKNFDIEKYPNEKQDLVLYSFRSKDFDQNKKNKLKQIFGAEFLRKRKDSFAPETPLGKFFFELRKSQIAFKAFFRSLKIFEKDLKKETFTLPFENKDKILQSFFEEFFFLKKILKNYDIIFYKNEKPEFLKKFLKPDFITVFVVFFSFLIFNFQEKENCFISGPANCILILEIRSLLRDRFGSNTKELENLFDVFFSETQDNPEFNIFFKNTNNFFQKNKTQQDFVTMVDLGETQNLDPSFFYLFKKTFLSSKNTKIKQNPEISKLYKKKRFKLRFMKNMLMEILFKILENPHRNLDEYKKIIKKKIKSYVLQEPSKIPKNILFLDLLIMLYKHTDFVYENRESLNFFLLYKKDHDVFKPLVDFIKNLEKVGKKKIKLETVKIKTEHGEEVYNINDLYSSFYELSEILELPLKLWSVFLMKLSESLFLGGGPTKESKQCLRESMVNMTQEVQKKNLYMQIPYSEQSFSSDKISHDSKSSAQSNNTDSRTNISGSVQSIAKKIKKPNRRESEIFIEKYKPKKKPKTRSRSLEQKSQKNDSDLFSSEVLNHEEKDVEVVVLFKKLLSTRQELLEDCERKKDHILGVCKSYEKNQKQLTNILTENLIEKIYGFFVDNIDIFEVDKSYLWKFFLFFQKNKPMFEKELSIKISEQMKQYESILKQLQNSNALDNRSFPMIFIKDMSPLIVEIFLKIYEDFVKIKKIKITQDIRNFNLQKLELVLSKSLEIFEKIIVTNITNKIIKILTKKQEFLEFFDRFNRELVLESKNTAIEKIKDFCLYDMTEEILDLFFHFFDERVLFENKKEAFEKLNQYFDRINRKKAMNTDGEGPFDRFYEFNLVFLELIKLLKTEPIKLELELSRDVATKFYLSFFSLIFKELDIKNHGYIETKHWDLFFLKACELKTQFLRFICYEKEIKTEEQCSSYSEQKALLWNFWNNNENTIKDCDDTSFNILDLDVDKTFSYIKRQLKVEKNPRTQTQAKKILEPSLYGPWVRDWNKELKLSSMIDRRNTDQEFNNICYSWKSLFDVFSEKKSNTLYRPPIKDSLQAKIIREKVFFPYEPNQKESKGFVYKPKGSGLTEIITALTFVMLFVLDRICYAPDYRGCNLYTQLIALLREYYHLKNKPVYNEKHRAGIETIEIEIKELIKQIDLKSQNEQDSSEQKKGSDEFFLNHFEKALQNIGPVVEKIIEENENKIYDQMQKRENNILIQKYQFSPFFEKINQPEFNKGLERLYHLLEIKSPAKKKPSKKPTSQYLSLIQMGKKIAINQIIREKSNPPMLKNDSIFWIQHQDSNMFLKKCQEKKDFLSVNKKDLLKQLPHETQSDQMKIGLEKPPYNAQWDQIKTELQKLFLKDQELSGERKNLREHIGNIQALQKFEEEDRYIIIQFILRFFRYNHLLYDLAFDYRNSILISHEVLSQEEQQKIKTILNMKDFEFFFLCAEKRPSDKKTAQNKIDDNLLSSLATLIFLHNDQELFKTFIHKIGPFYLPLNYSLFKLYQMNRSLPNKSFSTILLDTVISVLKSNKNMNFLEDCRPQEKKGQSEEFFLARYYLNDPRGESADNKFWHRFYISLIEAKTHKQKIPVEKNNSDFSIKNDNLIVTNKHGVIQNPLCSTILHCSGEISKSDIFLFLDNFCKAENLSPEEGNHLRTEIEKFCSKYLSHLKQSVKQENHRCVLKIQTSQLLDFSS